MEIWKSGWNGFHGMRSATRRLGDGDFENRAGAANSYLLNYFNGISFVTN